MRDEYLQNIGNEMRKAGAGDVSSSSRLGVDAAHEIVGMAREIQADLVVMATRGSSPLARWAFGSVSELVLRDGYCPILLIKKASKQLDMS